jgi:hypothetical protein
MPSAAFDLPPQDTEARRTFNSFVFIFSATLGGFGGFQ